MKTDWVTAGHDVQDRHYQVFQKKFWYRQVAQGNSSDSRRKAGEFRKARAKVVLANIFTVGLVNLGWLIRYRIAKGDAVGATGLWESKVKTKLSNLCHFVPQRYSMDETAFREYFKYVFFGRKGTAPAVLPENDNAFALGWSRFVDDYQNQLEGLGMRV